MDAHISLPPLTTKYAVTELQRQEYTTNGHVLLKSILAGNEVSVYRAAINETAHRFNTEKRKMAERDTYGKAFLQIMNLWEMDEAVRNFTLARRFAGIAASLMGVENVRLYHDQALYKEPGGGPTPWHQDQYYWPLDTTQTITMWMPMVDIGVDMGMLTFASGSHSEGAVGNLAISDESEAALDKLVKDRNYPVTRATTMKAGDATFHAGWTLHCAPGNASPTMREVMTVIFFADGAKVAEPKNKHQENDRNRWLSGYAPGRVADSKLNPALL